MKNNKKLITVLTLASALLLTGCDDIMARPNKDVQNQTYINNSNVSHNTVNWLYDTMHGTNVSSEIVKDTLFKVLAEDVFGVYKFAGDDVVIEGYDDVNDTDKLVFVQNHKAYWSQEKTTGSEKSDYVEPTSLTDEIKTRIDLYKSIVKKHTVVALYNVANTSSYIERNYFSEVKLVRNLIKNYYTINGLTYKEIFDEKYDNDDTTFTCDFLIDSSITTTNIDSIIGNDNNNGRPMLHFSYYTDYINEELLDDVMNTLLIEQYIYDNQYTAISRAHYRKIKYVQISTDNTNVFDAHNLLSTFVDQYVVNAKENEEIDYSLVDTAWKGVWSDIENTAAQELLEDAGFEIGTPTVEGDAIKHFADGKSVSEHPYYENTKYGDVIEDYAKITLNPKTTDSTAESTFTSNGSYSIETGLEIQTNTVKTTAYCFENWGSKDSGFSDLPSNVKAKLFDYTVMTDFNNPNNIDKNSYVKDNGNGHYFLRSSIAQLDEPNDAYIIKDDSSFYIVEIIEAPSQAKLTINGINQYDTAKREEIARTIGYEIASSSTYRSSAFSHYLENCEIIYHDQSIYDYFSSNYPELFD